MLTSYLQSIARVIFGFLVLRHGMEQVFAFPEASSAARMSFEGVLELIALPAGVLIMLGLLLSLPGCSRRRCVECRSAARSRLV